MIKIKFPNLVAIFHCYLLHIFISSDSTLGYLVYLNWLYKPILRLSHLFTFMDLSRYFSI